LDTLATKSSAHLMTVAGNFSLAQACSALYPPVTSAPSPHRHPDLLPALGANTLSPAPNNQEKGLRPSRAPLIFVLRSFLSPRSNCKPEFLLRCTRNASTGIGSVSENFGIIGNPYPIARPLPFTDITT